MSHRSTLRTAILTAVAAAAVLVPPPGPSRPTTRPHRCPPPHSRSAPRGRDPVPTEASRPSPATPTAVPRGGVAAGERPVGTGDDTAALYGSAIGAVLLAGAGTVVLRRRTAAQRNS
ncbi:LPXTG cell wall anchor domain-containing protein [Streptomyces sp. M10(2022)]